MRTSGPYINKDRLHRHRHLNSHHEDKAVLRSSYLYGMAAYHA